MATLRDFRPNAKGHLFFEEVLEAARGAGLREPWVEPLSEVLAGRERGAWRRRWLSR